MDRFLRVLILGFLLLCFDVFHTKAQTTVQLTANPITANGVTFTLSGNAEVTDWKGGAFSFPTKAYGTTSEATVTISQRIKITSLYFSWGTNVQGASVQLYDGATLKQTIPWPGNGTTVPVSNVVADKLIFKETGPSQNGSGDLQSITFKDVTVGPTITTTALSSSSFTTCEGTWSTLSTFTVSGTDLTNNITITAPAGYQISDNSVSGFSGSVSLSPADGAVTAKTIYVRLDGTSTTSSPVSGNISIASTGATMQTLAVSGTVNKLPAIITQPQDQVISVGEMAVFAVEGANVTTYEWEISTNGGAWSKNGTGKSFSFVGSSSNKYRVRCKLINSCGHTYSNEVRYSYEITPDNQNRLFVNKNVSSGLKNGSSWANAIPELADALKWARQNKDAGKWSSANPLQIWVAGGTYYPLYSAADNELYVNGGRNNAFVMVKEVQLYGGFAGIESTLADRDLTNSANKTVLSGDIDENGILDDGNAYHVVITHSYLGDYCLFDGFTITGGLANGDGNDPILFNGEEIRNDFGGGIYNLSSNLEMKNIQIIKNEALSYGGGMYGNNLGNTFNNITFKENASEKGGGIYLQQSYGSLKWINIELSNNTATQGGGVYEGGTDGGTYINALFSSNTANEGGAIYSDHSFPVLTNATVVNNSAGTVGSGIYYKEGNGNTPQINNSIFLGNNTTVIYNTNASYTPVLKNNLLQGYNASDNGNISASGITLTDIFTNATNGDYTLKSGKATINAGDIQLYWDVVNDGQAIDTESEDYRMLDLASNQRLQKGAIDLGAYESSFYGDPKPGVNNILYVKKDGAGINDGSSWDNALPELADALKWARQNKDAGKWSSASPLQIWVAGGTYYPMYNAADGVFTTDGNKNNAFVMVKDVQLYGSFAGTETNLSDRNLNQIANKTILSGDIDQNNTVDENNVNHVVIASGDIGNAVLNGFTISGGNASVSGNISVNGNSITKTSGGGIFTFSSLLNIQGVHLTGNNTTGEGGALYIEGNVSPVLTNVIITGNNALIGGGICNKSSTSFFLTNVTIGANNASAGGAIYLTEAGTSLKIRNSIIKGNKQGNNPVTIGNHTDQATIDFHYSLVDSYASYSRYASEENVGNIDATDKAIEDIFVYPLVAGLNTGGDYTLKAGSAAINKGSSTFYQAGQTPDISSLNKDLVGNTRVFDGTIDIGAYERQMKQQLITLANVVNDTLAVTYGDANVVATGTGAITYTSSNSGIVEAGVDGLKIKAAGEANISVTAAGNAIYDPVTRTLPVKVAKKNLAITNTSRNKTYGEILTSTDFTGTITGIANNDNITVSRNSTGAAAMAVVDTYTITATLNDPDSKLANYEVSHTDGTLTVDKKALTVTVDDKTKVYGDANPAFTVSYDGLVNGETALTPAPTLTTIADEQSITGNYDITASGTSANYDVTFETGTLTIGKKDLTVITTDRSKIYGETLTGADFEGTISGIVNNDNITVSRNSTGSGSTAIVNTYAIIATLNDPDNKLSNYEVSNTAGTLTVNKKALTVTAEDKTKTYGEANPAFTVTYNGLVNGETALTPAPTLTTIANAQSVIGDYDIAANGTSANYDLTFETGTLTIGKRTLTITNTNRSKTYGETLTSADFTGTITGITNNDNITVNRNSNGSAATANAATYQIIATVADPGNKLANYEVSNTNGELTVDKAALSIKAEDAAKIYGDDNPVFSVSYTGLQNNDTGADLTGTLTFDGSATTAVNVGTYTIEPKGLSSGNYDITYHNGTFSITKALLNITANSVEKDYDGQVYSTNPTVTYEGFKNNDTESTLAGNLSFTGSYVSAKNAGTYIINPRGLSSSNYDITFTPGNLTINKVALEITANDFEKTYDGLTYTGGNGVRYSGFVNAETAADLQGTLTYTGSSQNAKNVGAYLIRPRGLNSGNYQISYYDGSLDIRKASLQVTAKNDEKVYDGVAYTGGKGVDYIGFVNNETSSVLSGALAYDGSSQGAVSAGNNYTITPKGLSAANYELVYTSGTLKITKAPLTVTANNFTKTYDGLAYTGGNGVVYQGLVNNEPSSVLTGTITYSGNSQQAVSAGEYDIAISGLYSNNYTIDYEGAKLTINPKVLTVTNTNLSKTYGETLAATDFTGSVVGLVLGDNITVSRNSDGAQATAGVNTYSIIASLNDPDNKLGNYILTNTSGTLTVNQKELIITAKDQTKTYGDALTFGGTEFNTTGLVNADEVNTVTLNSVGAIATATASVYPIAVSNAQGSGLANYNISYTEGNLTVNPKTITVTATGNGKIYGAAEPQLVYTYTPELVNGDSFSGNLQRIAGENVNIYQIHQGNLALSNNYILDYVGANFSITPKALTVTAENKTKIYGEVNPELTMIYDGLVNGETALSPLLVITTVATVQSGAGTYDINVSGTSENYNITFNKGTLTVGQKALTVTVDNKTKVYGEANPELTVSYDGLVNGETTLTPMLTITALANEQSAIGNYDIVASGTSANYEITFEPGTLTIGKKALTITNTNRSKTYGETLTAADFEGTIIGIVNNDDITVSRNSTGAQALAGVDTYSIVATLNDPDSKLTNYEVSNTDGTLTVNKKALTVRVDNKTKTYGEDNPVLTVSYDGLVNGETALAPVPTLATEANKHSIVGSYDIMASGVSANYDIVFESGTLTVGKKTLTITNANQSKIYGETLESIDFTGTISGIVNNDNITVSRNSIGAVATAGVNTYAITATLNDPDNKLSNYEVSNTAGTLTVDQKALTVKVDNKTKVYGEANPELTVSYDGLVNGETALTPMLTVTALANEQSAIGNYDIVASGTSANYEITFEPGTLTIGRKTLTITNTNRSKTYGETLAGADFEGTIIGIVNNDDITVSRNSSGAQALAGVDTYSIVATLNDPDNKLTNYEISNTNGTLTVNKKALTIRADDQTKTYGEANPVFTVSYDGLVNDEIVLTPAPMITTLANEQSIVGSYEIIASGTSANYDVTFNKGTLTISKKQLTVTSLNRSKVYGEALTSSDFTGTLSGLANNDNITVSRNSTGAPAMAAVNAYPIIVSLDDPDNKLANYEVANIQGVLTVNKKALIVRADNKAKIYGEVNPVLSVSYQGLENGETSLPLVPAISTTATQQSATGEYPITVVATSDNYELTVVPGILTVGKKPITVTADNQQKVYGETDPQLTYTYTPSLINGDVFSGNLFRTDGENVTEYAIGLGSLTLGDNYSINYNPAKLTVTKAMLYVKADHTERCYGADNPNFNISYEGFKFSDNPTSLTAQPKVITNAVQTSDVGTYILLINGGKSSNYDFIYEEGLLKVNPLPKVSITSNRGNSISKGETVTLTANGGSVYYWSNADGILGTQSNPVLEVRPMKTTTYTVTATNESGCATTESFTIEVKEDYIAVKAENFITPNGDGVNDNWVVTNVDAYPEHTLTIVDRSGKVLYKTRNYRNEWDGTANGLPLSAGTYYYIFDFEGKNAIKGFITIVK